VAIRVSQEKDQESEEEEREASVLHCRRRFVAVGQHLRDGVGSLEAGLLATLRPEGSVHSPLQAPL